MDEAKLCERIALIQDGKIMSVDTPANIIKSYPDKLFAAKSDNIYKLLKDFRSHPEVNSCFAFGEYIHITLRDQQLPGLDTLNGSLPKINIPVYRLRKLNPELKTVLFY